MFQTLSRSSPNIGPHVPNDVNPFCLYLNHWEVGNPSVDHLEVSALVSTLLPVSLGLCVLLAASSRLRGSQDELDELWPLFSSGGGSVDGIGFPQAGLPWEVFVTIVLCHSFWRRMWSRRDSPSCIAGVLFVAIILFQCF